MQVYGNNNNKSGKNSWKIILPNQKTIKDVMSIMDKYENKYVFPYKYYKIIIYTYVYVCTYIYKEGFKILNKYKIFFKYFPI